MKPVFASGSSKRPTVVRCTERAGGSKGAMWTTVKRQGILDPSMNEENAFIDGSLFLVCDQGTVITLTPPAVGFDDDWLKEYPASEWSGGITFSLEYDGVSGPSAPPKNQDCRYFFDPIRPELGFVNKSPGSCDIADGNMLRIGTETNDIATRPINVYIRTSAQSLTLRSDFESDFNFAGDPGYQHPLYSAANLGSRGMLTIRVDPMTNICGGPKNFDLVYPEPVKFKHIGGGANRVVNETERFYIGVKYNRLESSGVCNRKIEPKVTFSLGAGKGELLDDNIHIDLKEVGLLLSLKTASNVGSTPNKDVVFGLPVSLRSISVAQHRRTVFTAFDAKLTRNPQRSLTPGAFNQIVLAEIEYD